MADDLRADIEAAMVTYESEVKRAIDGPSMSIKAKPAILAGTALASDLRAILAAHPAEERSARIVREWDALCREMEWGDGVTEPQATPSDVLDSIKYDRDDARDHAECAVICQGCGEQLAATLCEHCGGGGTSSSGPEECQWCAGAGKIHEGCAGKSYAELAALGVEVSDRG